MNLQALDTYLRKKFNRPEKVKIELPFWHPWALIATFFGSGRMPLAGTAGSAAALPIGWLLADHWGQGALLAGAVFATLLGILAADWVEEETHSHDASAIVIDEVAGMWLTCLFLPLSGIHGGFDWWVWWGAAFILFRIMDIVKPFPANVIDRHMPGAAGVMLDDIIAGLYAFGVIQLSLWLSGGLG